ncbi:helix-turn-helix domain-containing protein [Nocardia halotolerans]|uniref:Helix-turn-helix domain-containing protein n=1 Tax=Nocardia halotolerans TaxID=1755878 RepID=A0ABV8VDQ0_9NOCA
MTGSQAKRIEPGEIDTEVADRALRRVRDYLTSHPTDQIIRVAGETGAENALILPRSVVNMVAFVLAQAAEGQGVSIVPSHAELTTQQVADLLNVSRPFVVGLLESGEIPFRLVGTHRRIRYDDLKEYQRRSASLSRAAADELSDLGQELGI